MRPEMFRRQIGRRQRQRLRGRTVASPLDAVADDAVRGEQRAPCAIAVAANSVGEVKKLVG